MQLSVEDPRVPCREDSVLRYLLEKHADRQPDTIFIKMPDGEAASYAEFREQVIRVASGLAKLGVTQGDMIATWLPNSLDAVRIWFAINWLGAIHVPINTAYKGRLLAHVLDLCAAKLLISHGDLIDRLEELEIRELQTIVVVGGQASPTSGSRKIVDSETLFAADGNLPDLVRPIEPWDTQTILFTSGTTGPSKGVVSSYAHLAAMGGREALPMLSDDELLLAAGPLFHGSGMMPIYAMLIRGATAVLLPAFSTSTFWPIIRDTGTTAAILLGVMSSFLAKEPPSPRDRDHGLRSVIFVPLPEDWSIFAERFGVTGYTCFNMSETAVPIVSVANPAAIGTCGRLRSGVNARIVDEFDRELPDGTVGELMLRAEAPWSMTTAYLGNPEATVSAWRNGWFHTGDAFRRDAQGNYFFVDRLKDAIRRRGENISSHEVETEILLHPKIRECAVIAVPSETSEDEVLAVVAARAGMTLDPADIHRFLEERLAHFMLPRYIRILDSLPRTPTEKVRKDVLRSEGITENCWDRDVAGIKVRRTNISA